MLNIRVTLMDDDSIPPEELDRVFRVLANQECRLVLSYFRKYSTEQATVSDLVEFILKKNRIERNSEQVETTLYHSTLPRMAEVEVIDYDVRSKSIQYHGHWALEPWLNQMVECEEVRF